MRAVSLWERIEPLLAQVEKPSRYLNHEYNAVVPLDDGAAAAAGDDGDDGADGAAAVDVDGAAAAPGPAAYRAALLYPDTYELGQSNQAIAILYHLINAQDGCAAERVFLPWVDMITRMREADIPLFALESASVVASFDLLGVTLPHELAATNILEALDLAGLPLRSTERGDDHPLVIGGGPGAFNPEPLAVFFDAFVIGEGEDAALEIINAHRASLARREPRAGLLAALATIEGVYVPAIHAPAPRGSTSCEPAPSTSVAVGAGETAAASGIFARIKKRVVADFDACPVVTDPIVPFAEVTHDRLAIEILRGCSRGCRFCQAGMIYRPVRERRADTVIEAVARGLACTGYDEVSLTSLSTTDHSQIEQILRRLNHMLAGTGIGLSIPSQRLDAFGVAMARLIAGERKTGLTFAPEAGTQRLRDAINKNVTEADLLGAIEQAYAAGWLRCKLYFMIGLPGETDDDVCGIAELANRAYATAKDAADPNRRSNVRMSVSVAIFVPKPHTPFQWGGQIESAEAQRRIELIRATGLRKGIDLRWHDPASSRLEAALSRAGREASELIEQAWQRGARFDAWSDRFDASRWESAAADCGLDIDALAGRDFALDEPLPWDHIDSGVTKDFLKDEFRRSREGVTSEDCSFASCVDCGVCPALDAQISLGGDGRG
jgi:radical SAM family uncharacterized protein